MPLSYHGFGPTAILIMIACVAAKQGYDYWKRTHPKV